MSEKDQGQYVSIKEFAKTEHYGQRQIRRLLNEGRLEGYRITEGGKWLIKKDQKIESSKLIQKRHTDMGKKLEEHESDLASALNKLIGDFRIIQQYGSVDGLPIDEIIFKEKDTKEMEAVEPFLGRCLLKHIQIKMPELNSIKAWGRLRPEDITGDFLDKLSTIAYKKEFKDTTCDICESWK